MDRIELTQQILSQLIAKAGANLWSNDTVRDAITLTAMQMAAQIIAGLEPEEPDPPEEPPEDFMPNAIYYKMGTPVIFGSEGGDTVAWSTENISSAAGRQSSFHDQGADGTARPHHWRYRFYTQCQATPTVGAVIRLLLKTSDGTHPDNDDGATDAAISSINKLLNLFDLRPVVVDEAAANIEYVSTGVVLIPARYFGVALWNASGATITNDDTETKAVFTPYYAEVQ